MKLIFENWRRFQLNEIFNSPVPDHDIEIVIDEEWQVKWEFYVDDKLYEMEIADYTLEPKYDLRQWNVEFSHEGEFTRTNYGVNEGIVVMSTVIKILKDWVKENRDNFFYITSSSNERNRTSLYNRLLRVNTKKFGKDYVPESYKGMQITVNVGLIERKVDKFIEDSDFENAEGIIQEALDQLSRKGLKEGESIQRINKISDKVREAQPKPGRSGTEPEVRSNEFENWRRYLAEQKGKDEIALMHEDGGPYHKVYLYRLLNPETLEIDVVGFVHLEVLSKRDNPCIPDTMEIAGIFTSEANRGEGFGRLLYDFAFYLANERDYGLTSDHTVSTSGDARSLWDSVLANSSKEGEGDSSSLYIRRTTIDDNDEFDYDESTEDPDDDCTVGAQDRAATDYSFEKRDHGNIPTLFKKYKYMHEENKLSLPSAEAAKNLEAKLVQIANDMLNKKM